ncbi:citrate lyase holo-[acyl-carrier protein] synthase [Spiroplasma endosymbiont of Aspidapion aeneum]|uniref:citrate lyase holo-[acyl-carrier protein] synthase n=1 Tax=Spiroplasma endosymbiont of Aspidapion aeneum TaxID=3066276 RepID=UPI00313CF83C
MLKSLQKILKGKEEKQEIINNLFKKDIYIISLNTNFPGKKKNIPLYKKFFNKIEKQISVKINEIFNPQSFIVIKNNSGITKLYVIDKTNDGVESKLELIAIENNFQNYSKYIDLDLYIKNDKLISRSDLNIANKKCFICNNDAKICTRNKNHSIDELVRFVKNDIYKLLKMR